MDCKVNRDLVSIKLVYFMYLGAFACMLPYISVFFIHIGLSVWQVGILRALEPLLTFVCSPLWGALADKYSKHRLATTLAISGAGIFYFVFLFVPLITGVSPENLISDDSDVCPNDFQFQDYWSTCRNSEYNATSLYSSTDTSHDECKQLCSAIRDVKGHSDDEPGYFLCQRENGGEFACDSCATDEEVATLENKTASVVYGLSCSQVIFNGTHKTISSSSVPYAQNGVGASCYQSSCCQCVRTYLPNPRQGTTFGVCIVIALLAVAFNCNILMFFDAIAMELLKGRRKDYGKNRLWGSVSWGVFAFLSGYMIDLATDLTNSKADRFEPAFFMYLIAMAVCAAIFFRMRLPEHKKPVTMKKDLKQVLGDGEVILFLFVVMITGIAFVLTFTYVFIFMKKELDSPYVLVGLAVTLTAVAEIPFMYFSGTIIKRVGYSGVMYMILIAYVVRYFGYSLIHNPWFILPVQLLHGITYGLAWPMFTAFANAVAPKGMASILQSIVACSFMGIGAGFGNFAGGIIYENYGARVLFRCTGTICAVTIVIFFLSKQFLLRNKKKKVTMDDLKEEHVNHDVNHDMNHEMNHDKNHEITEIKGKDMIDVPIDAVNWADVEKNELASDEETNRLFTVGDKLHIGNNNQNNTNADVHF